MKTSIIIIVAVSLCSGLLQASLQFGAANNNAIASKSSTTSWVNMGKNIR